MWIYTTYEFKLFYLNVRSICLAYIYVNLRMITIIIGIAMY
jgi:hypothetical protein